MRDEKFLISRELKDQVSEAFWKIWTFIQSTNLLKSTFGNFLLKKKTNEVSFWTFKKKFSARV